MAKTRMLFGNRIARRAFSLDCKGESVGAEARKKSLHGKRETMLAFLRPRRDKESRARRFSERGRVERNESGDHRAVPVTHESEGHGIAGSADRAIKRTHQLSNHPPQVPRKRSCIAARVDHDGQQAPAAAGLSEPARPGSVSRDCGTTQLAQIAQIS
jgi:hypothetical protein